MNIAYVFMYITTCIRNNTSWLYQIFLLLLCSYKDGYHLHLETAVLHVVLASRPDWCGVYDPMGSTWSAWMTASVAVRPNLAPHKNALPLKIVKEFGLFCHLRYVSNISLLTVIVYFKIEKTTKNIRNRIVKWCAENGLQLKGKS